MSGAPKPGGSGDKWPSADLITTGQQQYPGRKVAQLVIQTLGT
jgi:hypothetical protein